MAQNHDYTLKTSDTRPTIRYYFEGVETNDDQDLDEVEVVSATFSMRDISTQDMVVDEAEATLVGEDTVNGLVEGEVEYQLESSATATPGVFVAEFTLVHRDGSVRRVPAHDNITIAITNGVNPQ